MYHENSQGIVTWIHKCELQLVASFTNGLILTWPDFIFVVQDEKSLDYGFGTQNYDDVVDARRRVCRIKYDMEYIYLEIDTFFTSVGT